MAKEDISYYKDRDDKEICRHLDACGGISAQKVDDGMVVFRLPKMEVVSFNSTFINSNLIVALLSPAFFLFLSLGPGRHMWLLRERCRR